MCIGGGGKTKTYEPAAAPAAPLGPAEVPTIGSAREQENKKNFGSIDGPKLRIRKN